MESCFSKVEILNINIHIKELFYVFKKNVKSCMDMIENYNIIKTNILAIKTKIRNSKIFNSSELDNLNEMQLYEKYQKYKNMFHTLQSFTKQSLNSLVLLLEELYEARKNRDSLKRKIEDLIKTNIEGVGNNYDYNSTYDMFNTSNNSNNKVSLSISQTNDKKIESLTSTSSSKFVLSNRKGSEKSERASYTNINSKFEYIVNKGRSDSNGKKSRKTTIESLASRKTTIGSRKTTIGSNNTDCKTHDKFLKLLSNGLNFSPMCNYIKMDISELFDKDNLYMNDNSEQ